MHGQQNIKIFTVFLLFNVMNSEFDKTLVKKPFNNDAVFFVIGSNYFTCPSKCRYYFSLPVVLGIVNYTEKLHNDDRKSGGRIISTKQKGNRKRKSCFCKQLL